MPKNIRETLKQEAEIYRGALGLINRIMEEDKNMDLDVLNCFKKMKTVAEEIDYLEQRSKRENIPDYELQRELSTFKIAGSLKFGLEDATAAKLDEYFFNMDPSIVKTEEGKNLVQVYLKSSAVESRKVTAWSLEKIELDRRFSSLLEKIPLEELRNIDNMIVDTQNKVNELSEKLKNSLLTQGDLKDEKVYKDLLKETQHLKDLKEAKTTLNEIGKSTRALKSLIRGEDAKSIIEENIMDDAQRLFEMDGMHKGSHNNSKEFEHMMNMMKMVMNWDDPDQSAYMDMLREEHGVNVPETMSEALDVLKTSAETYKAAKLEQHRPFPSPRRQFRLGLVDVILEFVDRHKAELDMGSVEKVEELKISNKPEVNVQVNAPENEPKIPELNVPIFQ